MKKHSGNKTHDTLPVKMLAVMAIIVAMVTGMASASLHERDDVGKEEILEAGKRDSIKSVKAFMQVYEVLISPRCVNCHPAGDVPLQGEEQHLHAMLPQRGIDGKGVSAMKCATCHQSTNTPGVHMPPGNPNWHLPPADMKMVFQGRTPHQLAKQLVDPDQNGHKSMEQLLAHASDGLVTGGWNPGEGRSLPPMSYEAFAQAWVTWIKKGAYAPSATSSK